MRTPLFEEAEDFSPTLAEIKSEYVAFLVESAFQNKTVPPQAEEVLEAALYYRLSVNWMGGHGNCVFTLGSRSLSSH
jgi:hypothetical protein